MGDDVEPRSRGAGFFARYTAPLLAYLACIVWLSHQPGRPGSLPFPHLDKLIHLVEFAIVGVLIVRWLARHPRLRPATPGRTIAFAVVLGIAFALLDEFHQSFVPGRSTEALDLVADAVGVSAGAWLWTVAQARFGARAIRGS